MKAEDRYHKWYCTWAGMYDAIYKCHECGMEFAETTDFHTITIKPKKGCKDVEDL